MLPPSENSPFTTALKSYNLFCFDNLWVKNILAFHTFCDILRNDPNIWLINTKCHPKTWETCTNNAVDEQHCNMTINWRMTEPLEEQLELLCGC